MFCKTLAGAGLSSFFSRPFSELVPSLDPLPDCETVPSESLDVDSFLQQLGMESPGETYQKWVRLQNYVSPDYSEVPVPFSFYFRGSYVVMYEHETLMAPQVLLSSGPDMPFNLSRKTHPIFFTHGFRIYESEAEAARGEHCLAHVNVELSFFDVYMSGAELVELNKGAHLSGRDVLYMVLDIVDALGCIETVLYDRATLDMYAKRDRRISKGIISISYDRKPGMRKEEIPYSLMRVLTGDAPFYCDATKATSSPFLPLQGAHFVQQENGKVDWFYHHYNLTAWAAEVCQSMPLDLIAKLYPEQFTYRPAGLGSDSTLMDLMKHYKAQGKYEYHLAMCRVYYTFCDSDHMRHYFTAKDVDDRRFMLAWNILYNTTVMRRTHPNNLIDNLSDYTPPKPMLINPSLPIDPQVLALFEDTPSSATCVQDHLFLSLN